MDAGEIERQLIGSRARATAGPPLTGPVTVLSEEPRHSGGVTYRVSLSRLVEVGDDDPALAGVCVPVPVTAAVDVDGQGSVVGVSVPDADPGLDREARAYTRNLIASGSVRGLSGSGPVRRGPPTRATHEVTLDDQGRRIIRRSGFATAGPGVRSTTGALDARAHDGAKPRTYRRGAEHD
jgi:hypothetical protein